MPLKTLRDHFFLDDKTEFAVSALMEIPCQYKATLEKIDLDPNSERSTRNSPNKISHPPTISSYNRSLSKRSSWSNKVASAPHLSAGSNEIEVCPISLVNIKNMAFSCGHHTCLGCGENIQTCPICHVPIQFVSNSNKK